MNFLANENFPGISIQILLDILKSGQLPILGKFTAVERRGVRQRTLREIK